MKVHKIEDERLSTLRIALNKLEVALHHGAETHAKLHLREAQSALVTEGPFHEDRWKTVWLPVPIQQWTTRPDFIPEEVWPLIRLVQLHTFDDTLNLHYCSATRMKHLYPLGVHYISITAGDEQSDAILRRIQEAGNWASFYEKLEEYADELLIGEDERGDVYTASDVLNYNPRAEYWESKSCQEAWHEFQQDEPGTDFNDDAVRSEKIVAFMREWFRESTPHQMNGEGQS